jgi:type II secretion system protein N
MLQIIEHLKIMKQFFLKQRKWILYALYGIFLMSALLFLRFPSDMLSDYIQAGVHSKNPNLLVTFQRVSLSFPVGLKFTGAECRLQGPPEQTVFMAKKIIVRPRLWSLLGKRPEYRFTCQAFDGTITGHLNIMRAGQKATFSLSSELKDIHINDNSVLPSFIKDYLEGILEGSVTYTGDDLFDPDGTGEASLTLSKGLFKFTIPFLSIDSIDLKEALLKADLKNQNLDISDISLRGDNFIGQASGVINLKDPLKKSSLNLKCAIEPTSSFMRDPGKNNGIALLLKQSLKNGKLPFFINGTFEKPDFRLL